MDVVRLDLSIDLLLVRREQIKIMFAGGGHGFNDIFDGVFKGPVQQIQQQDRHLGVGQKLGKDIILLQIFRNRMVVCKIAVVDQGFVQSDKRMGSAGMPDTAFGGIALVRDPAVRFKIF